MDKVYNGNEGKKSFSKKTTRICSSKVSTALCLVSPSECPHLRRLASIHQTLLYIHQTRSVKFEGYDKRIQMLSTECELHRSCNADADAVLRPWYRNPRNRYIAVQTYRLVRDLPCFRLSEDAPREHLVVAAWLAFQASFLDQPQVLRSTPCFPKLLSSR